MKMSKKKKNVMIILSIVGAVLVLAIVAGALWLHNFCKPGEYTVVDTTADVQLVAHRGMRSVAPENTTASFEEAGKHGYWGAECDIFRTKDGVWVVSHDGVTYRMMDKLAWIENTTYEKLTQMKVDNGVNVEQYADLTICSLEEYLKLCETYHMVPVIELKSKNNTEYYSEIVALLKNYDLDPIYISFYIEDLQAMRALTDDKLYYLTEVISEEDIAAAKQIPDCGIDFNGNQGENLESGLLQKCTEEGLELATWTINDLDTMQALVDQGVTVITTDCIEYKQ